MAILESTLLTLHELLDLDLTSSECWLNELSIPDSLECPFSHTHLDPVSAFSGMFLGSHSLSRHTFFRNSWFLVICGGD